MAVKLRQNSIAVKTVDVLGAKIRLRADSMRRTVELGLTGSYPGDEEGKYVSVVVPRDHEMLIELRDALDSAIEVMKEWR